METIQQPDDGEWTAVLLAAISRQGAPPVSLHLIGDGFHRHGDGCRMGNDAIVKRLRMFTDRLPMGYATPVRWCPMHVCVRRIF